MVQQLLLVNELEGVADGVLPLVDDRIIGRQLDGTRSSEIQSNLREQVNSPTANLKLAIHLVLEIEDIILALVADVIDAHVLDVVANKVDARLVVAVILATVADVVATVVNIMADEVDVIAKLAQRRQRACSTSSHSNSTRMPHEVLT